MCLKSILFVILNCIQILRKLIGIRLKLLLDKPVNLKYSSDFHFSKCVWILYYYKFLSRACFKHSLYFHNAYLWIILFVNNIFWSNWWCHCIMRIPFSKIFDQSNLFLLAILTHLPWYKNTITAVDHWLQ